MQRLIQHILIEARTIQLTRWVCSQYHYQTYGFATFNLQHTSVQGYTMKFNYTKRKRTHTTSLYSVIVIGNKHLSNGHHTHTRLPTYYILKCTPHTQRFLGRMEKPDVDYIEGLSPATYLLYYTQMHTTHSEVPGPDGEAGRRLHRGALASYLPTILYSNAHPHSATYIPYTIEVVSIDIVSVVMSRCTITVGVKL